MATDSHISWLQGIFSREYSTVDRKDHKGSQNHRRLLQHKSTDRQECSPNHQCASTCCICAEDEPHCHAKILARRADAAIKEAAVAASSSASHGTSPMATASKRVVVLNRDLYGGALHKGDRFAIEGTTKEMWGIDAASPHLPPAVRPRALRQVQQVQRVAGRVHVRRLHRALGDLRARTRRRAGTRGPCERGMDCIVNTHRCFSSSSSYRFFLV